MVQRHACAEPVSPERKGQTDQVIGIDQVVRRRPEVELREYASDDIQLNAFIRLGSPPTDEAEAVAQSYGRNRGPLARRVVERAKRAAQQTDKRSSLFFGSAKVGQKIWSSGKPTTPSACES